MFKNAKVALNYKLNGNTVAFSNNNEDLAINYSFDGKSLKVALKANKETELVNLKVIADYNYPEDVRIMPNGYQSWSMTREYKKNEFYRGMNKLVKSIPLGFNMAGCSGDYMFREYPQKSGVFHGYTYSYIRTGNEFTLMGSLSEQEGYTIFNFDTKEDSSSSTTS